MSDGVLEDSLNSVADSPSPSLPTPSGSSKRKSKPVKRVMETVETEQPEPSESSMQKTSDGSNEEPTPTPEAPLQEAAKEVPDSVTPEMDQSEIMRRFTELLAHSQPAATMPGILPTAFQSLLAAAAAGCSMELPVSASPAPLSTSDTSDGFLQAVLTNSMVNLATHGVTPTNVAGNNRSAFTGFQPNGLQHRPMARGSASPATPLALSKGPVKRKLFDGNKDMMNQATSAITKEERIDLDDLENFAQMFKKQRIKFGFTQGDVGVALGRRYGTDFSQTTISRFEALNLSFKNMCKLRPLLKEWLSDAEAAIANGASLNDLLDKQPAAQKSTVDATSLVSSTPRPLGEGGEPHVKRRRKRTNLDMTQRATLDAFFNINPRPDHDRMTEIANSLELDRDVVRVWFCNRRQKLRRSDEPESVENPLLTSLKALTKSHEEMCAEAEGMGIPTTMSS